MSSPHWLDYIAQQIEELHTKTGIVLTALGHDPMPESIAAHEIESVREPELVTSAYSQGSLLIEAAMDHFMSFSRCISLPVLTVAPWATIRNLLESASVSAWLLAPQISASDRVIRSLQFRCKGLDQQVRFARVAGEEVEVGAVVARFEEVLQKAESYGLEIIRTRDGAGKKLRQRMPSFTDLARDQYDQESAYRLLSSIIHAHPWALQQLGFKRADDEKRLLLEKNLEPASIAYLGNLALNASRVPILYKCQLFGWPHEGLAELFHYTHTEFARVISEVSHSQ